jgi:hypothetical protein
VIYPFGGRPKYWSVIDNERELKESLMKKHLRILVSGMCLSTLPMAASAQGKGKGHNQQNHDNDAQQENEDRDRNDNNGKHDRNRSSSPVFTSRDRSIITDYFRNRTSNLPPGLAKRNGNLPPGLQKQLDRNGTLPPGLQKRVQPFPGELERRLPSLPPDYRRGTIGQDVIIYNSRTQRIIDIVHAVLGR